MSPRASHQQQRTLFKTKRANYMPIVSEICSPRYTFRLSLVGIRYGKACRALILDSGCYRLLYRLLLAFTWLADTFTADFSLSLIGRRLLHCQGSRELEIHLTGKYLAHTTESTRSSHQSSRLLDDEWLSCIRGHFFPKIKDTPPQ